MFALLVAMVTTSDVCFMGSYGDLNVEYSSTTFAAINRTFMRQGQFKSVYVVHILIVKKPWAR